MKTVEKTKKGLWGTIVVIGVILIVTFGLFFLNKNKDKEKNFINGIVGIHFAAKKSANNSIYGRVDLKTLPKTIKLDNDEYFLDYGQDFLTIKNFNDEELCNKDINTVGVEGVYVTGGIKVIKTTCSGSDMLVELKTTE